jgi:mannose-6-phosphate isomerase-like protein (cupin superfamily)
VLSGLDNRIEVKMDSTSATVIHVGVISVRPLLDGDDSGGSLTASELTVPVGAKVPAPHIHDAFEETIYGVSGATSQTIDGETFEIGPGQSVYIRRGQVHQFENRGSVDARFLSIATPGVLVPAYFRELGEVLAAAADSGPDPHAVGEVMRRYGPTPVEPAAA